MKKIYLFCATLFLSLSAVAQGVDVPLFDDDVPNLGRRAKPLDHIVVTPSQLPEVSVEIDDTKKQVRPIAEILKEKETAEKNKKTEIQQVAKPVMPETPAAVQTPSRPIVLHGQYSDDKSQELNAQLNNQVKRYQQAQERAEQEARERKLAAAKAEAERMAMAQQQAVPQQTEIGEQGGIPDSIKDLFGQSADVYNFDISGITLGMTPDEVVEKATDAGYRATKIEHGIPLHRTSFYNETCRKAGLHRLEVIQNCIVDMAKEDEVYYVSSITFAKDVTAEYIQVLFSTKATENISYKIYYENKGDNSLNFTRRNLAKKLRRRDAFVKMLYETYGAPDNSDQLVWGDLDKAYMRAQMQGSNYNAYLILEDKEIYNDDWADADEKKGDLPYRYSFTFGQMPEDE